MNHPTSPKRTTIICDIDGTIVDARQQEREMLGGHLPHQDLHGAVLAYGVPVRPVIAWLHQAADAGHAIHYVTGRHECPATHALLHRLQVPHGTIWPCQQASPAAHKAAVAQHLAAAGPVHALDDNPDHHWALTTVPGVTATLIPGWPIADHHLPIEPHLPNVETL